MTTPDIDAIVISRDGLRYRRPWIRVDGQWKHPTVLQFSTRTLGSTSDDVLVMITVDTSDTTAYQVVSIGSEWHIESTPRVDRFIRTRPGRDTHTEMNWDRP